MSEKERLLRLPPLTPEEALRAAMQIKPPTETGEKRKRQGRRKEVARLEPRQQVKVLESDELGPEQKKLAGKTGMVEAWVQTVRDDDT